MAIKIKSKNIYTVDNTKIVKNSVTNVTANIDYIGVPFEPAETIYFTLLENASTLDYNPLTNLYREFSTPKICGYYDVTISNKKFLESRYDIHSTETWNSGTENFTEWSWTTNIGKYSSFIQFKNAFASSSRGFGYQIISDNTLRLFFLYTAVQSTLYISNVDIIVAGYILDIKEITKNSTNDNTKPFSLSKNELLRDYQEPFYGITDIFDYVSNKIVTAFANGKETAELLCSIGEYYDTNNNLAISTKTSGLPMTFRIGDIVIPYIYTNKGDNPLSENENYTAKEFVVIAVSFVFNGAVWQKLTLQEKT